MALFRKRPIEIEAWQYDGSRVLPWEAPEWLRKAMRFRDSGVPGTAVVELGPLDADYYLIINTLEGRMCAGAGDWIIQGVKGEIYPCRDDIFRATYEAITKAAEAELEPSVGRRAAHHRGSSQAGGRG